LRGGDWGGVVSQRGAGKDAMLWAYTRACSDGVNLVGLGRI